MADLFGFIEWTNQTRSISKYLVKRIEREANFYIAYLSWLSSNPDLSDTKELRKKWYKKQKKEMLEDGLKESGI